MFQTNPVLQRAAHSSRIPQQVQIACAIGEAIEALTAGLQKISAQLDASEFVRDELRGEQTCTASSQPSLMRLNEQQHSQSAVTFHRVAAFVSRPCS